MSQVLLNKIKSKKAKIAVVGLGYVGLPLAVNFAKSGYRVFGLDKDLDRVEKIKRRVSYILDVKAKEIVAVSRKKRFSAGTDFSALGEVDVVIICVPTPLKRKYTPDISYILSAVRTIKSYLKKNMLIILESTTYPGTTEELIKPELEKSGLKAGRDFFLSFSPERIDPGNKSFDVTRIPKVVGGLTPRCGQLTKALYEKAIKHIHLVSSAKAAEMTKLLENSFRIINIAWINEVAMMSHQMGINVWEVIEAAKTKPFGFMPFYPGLGVGGHCIPDDPLYLYWKAKHHGFSSKFIKLSADINTSMVSYALGRLRKILKKKGKTLKESKVLFLGVTYKRDVKDLRKSSALTFLELLESACRRVDYHDPVIPYLNIGKIKNKKSTPLTPARLKACDIVVVAVDHTAVNYSLVSNHAKLIFDIPNVYKKSSLSKIIKY